MYFIEKVTKIDKNIANSLLLLWESSVRLTHKFLKDSDIISIREQVKAYLNLVDIFIVVDDVKEDIKAFMGVKDDKIEMLFVAPIYMRRGLGKMLVSYALDNLEIKYVDVNSDNDEAINFYTHIGFKVSSRSERDDFNNPFPIIHMIKEGRS